MEFNDRRTPGRGGNPSRPAFKKANKKFDKAAISVADGNSMATQERAAYNIGKLKAPISTSTNQNKKLSKRLNQSRIARGKKPLGSY